MPSDAEDLAANIVPIGCYDAAERSAGLDLSHVELMAFSPRTFALFGFPDRVSVEKELARHADWNHDTSNQDYFRPGKFLRGPAVQTDYTYDEIVTLTRVRDQAAELTAKRFGRAIRPVSTPFGQIGLFRIIAALKSIHDVDRLSVFEVGPGPGYLGAMLVNQGERYASMDNAQCFYLYQNRLLAHIAPREFAEWGHPDSAGYRKIARVTHLPWWEYLRLARECPFKADIVVSNANLGEMSRDAMRLVIRISRQMLADSKIGLFLFASIGYPGQNTLASVEAEFANVGYRKLFERLFYGFTPHGKLPYAKAALLDVEIPHYDPGHRPARLPGCHAVYLPDDQRPMDLDMVELLDGWTPPCPKAPNPT